MKAQFKLSWFYFRIALGTFLLALATAVLPKDSSILPQLIKATEGAEWEAGIGR